MANTSYGYVNEAVRAMYGIPYSQLTEEQRKILHADSLRRAKLIKERQEAVLKNNLKAFEDEAKMEKVLASIYRDCQKQILADVAETVAKVKKAGGTWSYANQSALTRRRGLFEQITQELNKLGQKEQNIFTQGLSNIYTDQFLRQVYELGQSIPVKANFNRLNPALVKKTLDYPWSGAMFSDRLWQDKATLGRNLRVGLTQSMILGEGIPEMTDRINKGIDTARYNAERVARTETKRVTYCAHNDAYEDMGVEELEYRCANGGDARVCTLCRADNGKHYKRGTEPTLPRHPNCRCVYIPVVSDEFGDNELNELTGSVRGAENYEKWKDNLKDEPKTAKDLIQADVDKIIAENDGKRRDIQAQIDTKNEEYKNVPAKYQSQIDDLEAKRVEAQRNADVKKAEMEVLYAEKNTIPQRREALSKDFEDGKYSEEEFDKLSAAIRDDRRRIRDKISEVESEYYDYTNIVEGYRVSLNDIQRKIKDDRVKIMGEVRDLDDKIRALYDSEKDLGLDIDFVGDDMDRYTHIKEFRTIRQALRDNPNFDFDTYSSELVKMAQRMDEDALKVQSALSDMIKTNHYGDRGKGWYSPYRHMVEMDMSSNTHERSLGNGLKGAWQTKYHEEGHQLDHLLSNVEEISGTKGSVARAFTYSATETGKKIQQAIETDLVSFVNKSISYYNWKHGKESGFKEVKLITNFNRLSREVRYAFDEYYCSLTSSGMDRPEACRMGILTDAIGLFTKDRLSRNTLSCGGWGHDSAYNKDRGENGSASETWATFCALRTAGTKEEQDRARALLPNTWSIMNSVYHDIAVYVESNQLIYKTSYSY